MSKIKLTTGRISAFECPAGLTQAFLWDSEINGLAVRAATGGKKSYVYQSRLNGKSLRLKIGSVSIYTIEDARHKSRRLQAMLDQGTDPRQKKIDDKAAADTKKELAIKRDQPALTAWQHYVHARSFESINNRWSARHTADHEAMSRIGGEPISRGRRAGMPATKQKGMLRPLLELPLKDVKRDNIKTWLNTEAAIRPTRARLALSLLTTFLNWCADQPEYRSQIEGNPSVRLKRELAKPRAKNDVLQKEQLSLWFDNVRQINNPIIAAYLQTLLLTGSRRTELAKLKWVEVDLRWNTMHLADKVNQAEGRVIPLTPYVKSLLLALKRDATGKVLTIGGDALEVVKPSPWVFASTNSACGYVTEPRIAHNKALTAAGLPALSIHGLRRSFSTLTEWIECPVGVVAQIMGHLPSATAEKHYKARPVDLLRQWHTKIEHWILTEAGIDQPAVKTAKRLMRV